MGTSFRSNAFLGDVTADLRYRLTLCFRSYILPTNMKLAVLTRLDVTSCPRMLGDKWATTAKAGD